MSIYKLLLRTARKAGPAAFLVVVRYGPQLRKLVRDNPEALRGITNRFSKVVGIGTRDRTNLARRVHILREQVTYLYASANTSEVAHQAAGWRAELESIEQVIPVLDAMSRRQQTVTRRELVRKIDGLSSQILAISLVDAVEDAEIVREFEGQSESNEDVPGGRGNGRKWDPAAAEERDDEAH